MTYRRPQGLPGLPAGGRRPILRDFRPRRPGHTGWGHPRLWDDALPWPGVGVAKHSRSWVRWETVYNTRLDMKKFLMGMVFGAIIAFPLGINFGKDVPL